MLSFRRLTLVSLALSLTALAASAAGTADGSLTINGKTTKLTFAAARLEKGFFDAKTKDVVLLLSDSPVDGASARDHFALSKLAEDGKLSAVELRIDKDKQVIGGMIYGGNIKKFGPGFSATGMHKFDSTTFTATQVAGRMHVDTPDDFFGNVWQYSATFSAPIEAAGAAAATSAGSPSKGKALPAGGGAPGKAFVAYLKVLQSGDVASLRKSVSAARAKQMDDPDFKKMLPMIREMEAKNIKIVSGTGDGSDATLQLTGTSDGQKATGSVHMIVEDGAWKVEKESWSVTSEN